MDRLLERIVDTLNRHHDIVLELQSLSQEFDEVSQRMRSVTDRLQARLDQSLDNVVQLPAADDFQLPNALRSGPLRRD